MTSLLESASLLPFLRIVRPALSRDLVPDACFSRIERLARNLPPAYGFIFECWLSSEKANVDIQLYYRAGEGAALARSLPDDTVTWRGARSLFAKFAKHGADLADGLWIEFDLGNHGLGEAHPRLGFAYRRVPFDRYFESLSSVYECLGRPIPVSESLLRRLYSAIPADGYLYGTGTGLAPTYAPLRWCLSFDVPSQMTAYLDAVGWPHPAPPIDVPGLQGVALAVDLSEGIGPRIGVEYYLADDAFEPFLRRLTAQNLCKEQWIGAFTVSRGIFTKRRATEWPEPLATVSALSGREASIILKPVHIKVTYEAGQPTAVKGYIYGNYVWIS